MTEMLIVRSKLKEAASECNVSSDFAAALDQKVKELVTAACVRAKANGRRTVQARDL